MYVWRYKNRYIDLQSVHGSGCVASLFDISIQENFCFGFHKGEGNSIRPNISALEVVPA